MTQLRLMHAHQLIGFVSALNPAIGFSHLVAAQVTRWSDSHSLTFDARAPTKIVIDPDGQFRAISRTRSGRSRESACGRQGIYERPVSNDFYGSNGSAVPVRALDQQTFERALDAE